MHVQRRDMLAQIKQVAKAVPKSAMDDALKGIHIDANGGTSMITMTATNNEVAIRAMMPATVEEAGSVVIDAKYLPPILEHLPGDTVDFEMHDSGTVFIRSGSADYHLYALPGDKYPMPELPFPDDTVSVTGLPALSRKTLFALGEDPKAPMIQCVRLTLGPDGLKAAGTNSFCIVEADGDPECKGKTELFLPGRSLNILSSISRDNDVYEMGLAGKHLVFWNGTLLFSARLMEGQFPNTTGVLDSFRSKYSVNLSVEELAEAIRTIAPADDSETRIKLAFGEHELEISSKTQYGEAVAAVKALVLNTPPKPFYYDYRKLLKYLSLLKGNVTLEFDDAGLLSIRPGETRYLQSPMRPPKEGAEKKKKAA